MNEFNQPSPEEMQFLQRYFFNGSEDIESQSLSYTEPPAHNIHEFTDYPPGYLEIRSEVRSQFGGGRRPRCLQLQSISDQIEFGQSEPHGGALSNVLSMDLKSSSLTSLPRNQTLSPKRINVGSGWVSCFDNIADSIFNPFSAKSKTSSNPENVELSEKNLSSDFLLGEIISHPIESKKDQTKGIGSKISTPVAREISTPATVRLFGENLS